MIPARVVQVRSTRSVMDSSKFKKLKFAHSLVPLVLKREKTSTWRLFDDKNLDVGDELSFIDQSNGKEFATAKILSIKEKFLGEIIDSDFTGHERFESKEKMFETYRSYYGNAVSEVTKVKMIDFKILTVLK